MAEKRVIELEVKTGSAQEQFDALRKDIKKATEELEDLNKEFGENSKEADEHRKKISELTKAYDRLSQSNTDLSATFEDIYGEVQPLTGRMGELEDRMYELALAGQTNTKEYKDLLAEVTRFRKAQIETDLVVDASAQTMAQKLGGALEGATSGFAAVQGAMGLVGTESEEVEKALLKVQSAMAIAQGVQGVREALPLMKGLGTTAVTAFKGMTNAGKAFAVTGIGLILTALASAYVMFEKFNKEAEEAEKKEKALEKAFEDTNRQIEAQNELLNFTNRLYAETTQKQLNEAKKRGASEQELTQITREGAKKRIEALAIETEEARKNFIASSKNRKHNNETTEALEKQFLQVSQQYADAKLQLETELADEEADLINKRKEKYKELQDKRKEELDQLKGFIKEATDYTQSLLRDEQENELKAIEEKYAERIKLAKKLGKGENEIREAMLNEMNEVKTKYAQAELDIEKEKQRQLDEFIKQTEEQRLDDEEAFFEEYRQNTTNQTQLEIDAVRERYFRLIELAEQYGLDTTELKRRQEEEINAIDQKSKDEQKQRQEQLEQLRIEIVKDGLNLISDLADLFGQKNEKAQKRAFNIKKAVGIAQTTIDTYQAAQSAYASQMSVPTPDAPIRAAIAAGFAVASGLAKVAAIARTKFEGGGAGASASSGGAGGSIPQPQAPNVNIVGNANVNQLEALGQKPVQAYVVSGEVTTAQALDRNRVQNATFG